jgi:hypothetical protein
MGISLGEFIRESMDAMLKPASKKGEDPLLEDREIFAGQVPPDTAAQHDRYLYD